MRNLAGLYNLSASADWQALLRHFELGEGFAFIVLMVPDEEGAEVCREALDRSLMERGKHIHGITVATPADLRNLAESLLDFNTGGEDGAIWVARAVPEGAPDYDLWREAWRIGVATLNQFRNPLRRKFDIPLIFVGAPWLQEVLRENSPDLWSVRTLTARVEPQASEAVERRPAVSAPQPETPAPDPELALAEAERLRGQPGKELALARLLHRAGLGLAARSKWQEAAKAFSEALELRERANAEPADLAYTGYQLGVALRWTADYGRGIAALEQARSRFQDCGNELSEANCLASLGDIALDRSDHAEARRRYEQALPLYRQVGNPTGEANSIQSLGDIALRRSDHAEARRRYEQALSLYRQVGDRLGEANSIFRLGDIAQERSDHAESRRRYEEALPLYRQAGNVLGEANCIWRLGEIALERSEHAESQGRHEQALALYRQLGNVLGEANCIQRLGDVALRRSAYDEAQRLYEQALPLYRQVGDVLGEASCIFSLGDIAYQRSDHAESRRRYEQALPLYRQVGDALGEANCNLSVGDIASARADHMEGRRRYERALTLYERIEDSYSIGRAHLRLARIAANDQDRMRNVQASREAWLKADRPDMIELLEKEFGEPQ